MEKESREQSDHREVERLLARDKAALGCFVAIMVMLAIGAINSTLLNDELPLFSRIVLGIFGLFVVAGMVFMAFQARLTRAEDHVGVQQDSEHSDSPSEHSEPLPDDTPSGRKIVTPNNTEETGQAILEGRILDIDLIKSDGRWVRAGQMPELAPYFQQLNPLLAGYTLRDASRLKGVESEIIGDRLDLKFKWHGRSPFGTVVLALLVPPLIGFTALLCYTSWHVLTDTVGLDGFDIFEYLVMILVSGAITAVITIMALRSLFNETHLVLSEKGLTINRAPFALKTEQVTCSDPWAFRFELSYGEYDVDGIWVGSNDCFCVLKLSAKYSKILICVLNNHLQECRKKTTPPKQ